jgi:hypothetical protein
MATGIQPRHDFDSGDVRHGGQSGDPFAVSDEQRNLIQETQRASRVLLDEPVNTPAASEAAR